MSGAAIIVGGGIAGAAAACHLAAAGARPLVIEREAGAHHKICGEFLSGETVAMLRALGVDPIVLGARPIGEVRLIHRRRVATARLPFPALSLSRRALDEALLSRAAALGARIERGLFVRDPTDLSCSSIFVATGKHRLRGVARPAGGGLTGLKMYFRLAPAQAAALGGSVELVLFASGYAGLQLVEGEVANLCLLTRDAAGGLPAAIAAAPHLALRLTDAKSLLARPLAIANLPYGMVHRPSAADPSHHYRLGDQWGMIPSFTGDGMALALATARLAARAHLAGDGAAAYHAAAARALGPRVRLAARLAEAALLPGLAPIIAGAARVAPALMRAIARATRVPEAARG